MLPEAHMILVQEKISYHDRAQDRLQDLFLKFILNLFYQIQL